MIVDSAFQNARKKVRSCMKQTYCTLYNSDFHLALTSSLSHGNGPLQRDKFVIQNLKSQFNVLFNVEPTSSIPLEDLSLKTLKSLVEMTTFENLVPRYTAIVPIFWSEIQQEQQQRRHPQHLLQNSQGDASCHTRTWRLQKKGYVGISLLDL